MALPDFARNLRRLMAREGLTVMAVVARTGLDERTVKGILSGANERPHARTLHRLASGLGVAADEFFVGPVRGRGESFDRLTNPQVDALLAHEPALFAGWTEAEFDELCSQFGTGGALTGEGVVQAARAINHKREVIDKVALVLETGEGELLSEFVELLYRRVLLEPAPPASASSARDSSRVA